jgi:hypothetical protein
MSLGSGIRNKPIPDPGVKKAPDPGSGSATLAFSYKYLFFDFKLAKSRKYCLYVVVPCNDSNVKFKPIDTISCER